MKYLIVVVVLLTSACAPMTEREREAFQYRKVEFQAKFVDFRSQCLRAGGMVFVDARRGMNRDGTPKLGGSYSCHRRAVSL